MTSLKSQAVHTALSGEWNEAIHLNQALLKEDPQDIDTLNRLAYAYSAIGDVKHAKSTYQKVLKLDTKNPIALRNLKRLTLTPMKTYKILKKGKGGNSHDETYQGVINVSSLFLEESGKTKVLELVNMADPRHISILIPGEPLFLRVKRSKVFAYDRKNQYIGMLPDNTGKRLLAFIKGGNCYDAWVKAIQNHRVSIFVKESKRAIRFKNQPSFTFGEKNKKFDKPLKSYESKGKKPKDDDDEDDKRDYEDEES